MKSSDLVSSCCQTRILSGSMCSECKEHCDVSCLGCDSDYPNGTESCKVCEDRMRDEQYEWRKQMGLESKE